MITDMDSRPLMDEIESSRICSCFELARELKSGEERKLEGIDHVCPLTMKYTCAAWKNGYRRRARTLPSTRLSLPLGEVYSTIPLTGWEEVWPVPIAESPLVLALVLTQWLEEPPDDRQARELELLPQWCEALRCLEQELARGVDPRLNRDDLDISEDILLKHGIPVTPGTAMYALSRIGKLADPSLVVGPTRGIRLSSFALAPNPAQGGRHGQMITIVSGISSSGTDDLRRQASQLERKHLEWWRRIPHSYLLKTDLRRLNRRQPDELTDLIEQHLNGEMPLAEVERRMVEQAYPSPNPVPADALPRIRRRIAERIRRYRKR